LEGEEFIREHSALLVAYRRRDWVTALNLLDDSRLASVFHLTPVYDIYRRRIAHFQTDAPPEDWDGVYAAEEKQTGARICLNCGRRYTSVTACNESHLYLSNNPHHITDQRSRNERPRKWV
jgi:hypothetical protein